MKKEHNELLARYQTLDKELKKEFRKFCYEKIGWSKATLYNKINGTTKITPLEQEVINALLSLSQFLA